MVLTRQFRGTLVAYREDSLDCTNCLVMLSGILDKHSFRWSSRLAHAEGMGGGCLPRGMARETSRKLYHSECRVDI